MLFSIMQLSESSSLFFLLELDIICISILNLICLRTPTNNSSTLCWMPAEVSMNLASHDLASFLPSEIEIFKSYLLHKFWQVFHIKFWIFFQVKCFFGLSKLSKILPDLQSTLPLFACRGTKTIAQLYQKPEVIVENKLCHEDYCPKAFWIVEFRGIPYLAQF